MAVYFDYTAGQNKGFINERLLQACNYELNINALEKDHKYKDHFKRLFHKAEKKVNPRT